ncbi:MAG: hypothetical protein ACRC31_07990, partial [Cetobacterium sp.]
KYGNKEFETINNILNNTQNFESKLKAYSSKTGKTLKKIFIDAGFTLGNFIEDTPRIAVALSEMEKGQSLKNAGKKIDDIFYNPSELTNTNSWLRDNMFPFWGFITSNIGQTARVTEKRPYVPITVNKLIQFSKGQEDGIYGLFDDKQRDQTFDNEFVRGNKNLKIGDEYLNIGSKFSYLEPFTYIDNIARDPIVGLSDFFVDSLGIQKSIYEAINNIDLDKKRPIDNRLHEQKGYSKERFYDTDLDKRLVHLLKSTFRIGRILEESLRDPDLPRDDQNAFKLDIKNIPKNIPSILFGKSYKSNPKTAIKEIKANITANKNNLEFKLKQTSEQQKKVKTTEEYKKLAIEKKELEQEIIKLEQLYKNVEPIYNEYQESIDSVKEEIKKEP